MSEPSRVGGSLTRARTAPSPTVRDGSEREIRLLARELERRLDELVVEAGVGRVRANPAQRQERLERYVGAMSPPRRLRLAAALHLLSRRLDDDLAAPGLGPDLD